MVELEDLILSLHPLPEWVSLKEWRPGTGYSGPNRRIDVVAFNMYPSKKYYRVAYEIKRSRGDFLRELKDPKKRQPAEEYFHETWFVVSDQSVASPEELPEGWGLLVLTKKKNSLRQIRRAAPRSPADLTTGMWSSTLRSVSRRVSELERLDYAGSSISSEEFQEMVCTEISHRISEMEEDTESAIQRAEKRELEAYRIQDPLRALALEAGELGIDWTISDRETVQRLIDAATARRLRNIRRTMVKAESTLSELVKRLS